MMTQLNNKTIKEILQEALKEDMISREGLNK